MSLYLFSSTLYSILFWCPDFYEATQVVKRFVLCLKVCWVSSVCSLKSIPDRSCPLEKLFSGRGRSQHMENMSSFWPARLCFTRAALVSVAPSFSWTPWLFYLAWIIEAIAPNLPFPMSMRLLDLNNGRWLKPSKDSDWVDCVLLCLICLLAM